MNVVAPWNLYVISVYFHRTKNGTELNSFAYLKDEKGHDRYELLNNGDLKINKITLEDDGKYICSNPETKETAEYNVIGKQDKNRDRI